MTTITVRIPKGTRVMVLEDAPMRIAWFEKHLEGTTFTIVRTVQAFRDFIIKGGSVEFIFIDYDLEGSQETGEDAVKWMKDRFKGPIMRQWALTHSWNFLGAQKIREQIPGLAHVPFGEFELEVTEG